ncbi:MAG: Holliday junction resolvase RuvX [Chlamydiales bacterium]
MKKRIVSIDYGLKRIGLAISDENQIIAMPIGLILATSDIRETIDRILEKLKSYEIEKFLVGYPLHLNGKSSTLTDQVNLFIVLLKEVVNSPVTRIDERLSTLQAERLMKDRGMSRKKRVKIIDAMSAAVLLQSHLGY